ncbi:hypothetical protein [Glaciimonas immobilis]|uniref:Uncharacterized protein n=1 Tax=Glaciimonas immobilis TaxID=728004 RepID=A0A840RW65_9BURK|nr:hypothetical protein [Glaciimonas immobilis]KAF3997422.1 hypothetical protein HAV38_12095 [Glaciimonas immobilis]MBB5200914.1 hypothetical protein [Glaciimonas immobilis]
MPNKPLPLVDQLRSEIAAAAARMIAEDGADYGSAKRKAAQKILGEGRKSSDFMPTNDQLLTEVRRYNALFFADTQPARLIHLRKIATEMMEELTMFRPYLTGAVANGTAGEHSEIHLQLFIDSPKDVEIFLLNKNVPFSVTESESANRSEKRSRGRSGSEPLEILHYIYKNEGIHLILYEIAGLRVSIKPSKLHFDGSERLDLAAVQLLIEESQNVATIRVT